MRAYISEAMEEGGTENERGVRDTDGNKEKHRISRNMICIYLSQLVLTNQCLYVVR